MRTAWLKLIIGFGVSLVAAVEARAQPLCPHTDSIESMVANADLVFVGKIVKVDAGKQAESDANGHNVTVHLEETLKQSIFEDPYAGLQITLPHRPSVVMDWKARACRLLVAYDSDIWLRSKVIELKPLGVDVMTADMKLLHDPDAVLEAARKAAGRKPAGVKRVHTFDVSVPRELITGTEWEQYYGTGGFLSLSVPVNEQLEKRALGYIRSKSPQTRSEGARAMRYFKSDENIVFLKTLLDDPDPTYVERREKGIEYKLYGARFDAYHTLKTWGVDVKEPVIEEEVRK